ncbi:hypothetical protein ZIOFF_003568 [Zingiber officinale]|uniref:Uncharacterized protein n=1 Tax=Zingiber officinale TaxID=94328 RepID=A0A8J5I6P6_ZINOF|nr:hypothetical protein ZIOFF_003568 [Zingiber officinale]
MFPLYLLPSSYSRYFLPRDFALVAAAVPAAVSCFIDRIHPIVDDEPPTSDLRLLLPVTQLGEPPSPLRYTASISSSSFKVTFENDKQKNAKANPKLPKTIKERRIK